jgi:hypothetical protein
MKLAAHPTAGLVLILRMYGATPPVLMHPYGMLHDWLSTGLALPLHL